MAAIRKKTGPTASPRRKPSAKKASATKTPTAKASTAKASTAKAPAAKASPARTTAARKGKRDKRPYEGPVEWLFPVVEQAYARLVPREEAEGAPAATAPTRRARSPLGVAVDAAAARIRHEETLRGQRLAPVPLSHWEDTLREYQRRKAARAGAHARAGGAVIAGMPAIAGQNNWTPLGPTVVARGQTGTRAAVGGRVSGIAIDATGTRVYVATANGGVFRSDDGGLSFRSTMEGFDVDPTSFASTSLACGAIAIDAASPDRVYVGTGEGDTDALFSARIVNALPAYRGIGPIRSDDGGTTWTQETSNPSLSGAAFFMIAVDPSDREHCVAATTKGLYERVLVGGAPRWERRRTGSHASVVVTRTGGATTWFAAPWGGPVLRSTNGSAWATVGTGFPSPVGRIALGVQADNPNVLYAFATTAAGAMQGVHRLDGVAGAWRSISGVPPVLPGGQGSYDACISVDPNNANRIFLGGDYQDVQPFPASIWRCDVSTAGASLSMTGTAIGRGAHSDVHVLRHVAGSSARLFAGTDGGVFEHANATGAGDFVSRNTGVAALCANFVAQHPTEPAVMYIGLQDNGTAKCVGEPVWHHVLSGDGGYCVVNWNNPFRVLLFANGSVYRANDGGIDYGSWSEVTPPGATWQLMAEPLVTTPYRPGTPAEADIVALGVGTTIYISSDFASTWPDHPTLPAGSGAVFSLCFASATRLFAGTVSGRVFRLDRSGGAWSVTRIDDAAAGALGLAGIVTDIAIDTSDATRSSIFITFGGVGDFRHVWRFNGTSWTARSGPAGSGSELLDVEHNAVQYDSVTNRVFVGADIGVWQSSDGGATWTTLERGLPDAPVFDLQIHPTARVLRAALHGRGVFEWKIDAPTLADVELFIRDTELDTGRGIDTDGRPDPTVGPTSAVAHWRSPNIKLDVPTLAGYQTATTDIDFVTFNEVIADGSGGVATRVAPPTVHNRVYAEVHNRGRVDAAGVRVTAAITNAATGLMLPAGYTASVVAGTPIADPKWVTLGTVALPTVHAGFPRIAAFDLPSTSLPMPASLPGNSHWCMVVFVHSPQDPFTSTERNVDALTVADRKVGQRNLHLVEFVGTPPPRSSIGMWAMLIVRGAGFESKRLVDLVIDTSGFPGDVQLVLPRGLYPKDPAKQAPDCQVRSNSAVKKWVDGYGPVAKKLHFEAKYPEAQYALLRDAMAAVAAQPMLAPMRPAATIGRLPLGPNDEHVVFVRIDPPERFRPGSSYAFDVIQKDSKTGAVIGASTYHVVMAKEKR